MSEAQEAAVRIRSGKRLRHDALLLTLFAFLLTAISLALLPSEAGADVRLNQGQRSAICQTFLQAEQDAPMEQIRLKGHAKTVQEECTDPSTPVPKDTITALCREAVTEIADGTIETDNGDVAIETTMKNNNYGTNPIPEKACNRVCFDWALAASCEDVTYGEVVTVDTPRVINTKPLNQLTGGLAFWALLACLVGIMVSASLWAMGNKGQHPGTELAGKNGFLVCCTAAFFVGAIPALIGWLDTESMDPSLDKENVHQYVVPTTEFDGRLGTSTTAPPPPEIDSDSNRMGRVIQDAADGCAAAQGSDVCFGPP